jgi:hypothetical protein
MEKIEGDGREEGKREGKGRLDMWGWG